MIHQIWAADFRGSQLIASQWLPSQEEACALVATWRGTLEAAGWRPTFSRGVGRVERDGRRLEGRRWHLRRGEERRCVEILYSAPASGGRNEEKTR